MNEATLLESWEERRVAGYDVPVVWYERGSGPLLLFLHGNWDHLMYSVMLEKLCDSSRILLMKQRGADCWKDPTSYNNLPVKPFLTDIETLNETIGGKKLHLVGHSWGATLALQYACRYPHEVEKVVLISLGPLDKSMTQFYKANVRRMIRPERLSEFDQVNHQFRKEFESGLNVSARTDEAYADLHSTLWAYSGENSVVMKQLYLETGGFRRVAAAAHPSTTEGLLERSKSVRCPTLIIYGYQDYEPIIQAFMLRERIPHADIKLLNQCSHFPWIDRPREFYSILTRFLS
jgi:proline iminopeptidase